MHLILDFDGTLVDSFSAVIEKFNMLAEEFNFKKICQEESVELRDLNSRQIVKRLQISVYKIPTLMSRARKEMSGEILKLSPFLNIPQVLKVLKNANFSLGILTSNSNENVNAWLSLNKMGDIFDYIYTDSNFLGKSRHIKKIVKKYKLNKSEVFYIGDETRDIDAAKQSGIYAIAVTWGFSSEKILLQHEPHYMAKKPEDLLEIFGLNLPVSITK